MDWLRSILQLIFEVLGDAVPETLCLPSFQRNHETAQTSARTPLRKPAEKTLIMSYAVPSLISAKPKSMFGDVISHFCPKASRGMYILRFSTRAKSKRPVRP